MPRTKLTKTTLDALPAKNTDVVYWDAGCPGFGVKVTPKGRKVFIVLYRTGGGGSRVRKYTIGPYGKVTLHQARIAAQRVFSAKLEGRDPAAEKCEARRRIVADRVEDLLETFIAQHLSQRRSGNEISRLLRREIGTPWGRRSIHDIIKRDVVEVIAGIEQRGAPAAANKALKSLKTFLRWCVGRAVLDRSPADGVPLPAKAVARDRVLEDAELAKIIIAARQIGDPYGGIVEVLALTGQRREEVAGMWWEEIDLNQRTWTLPRSRTKNDKVHVVHLSKQSVGVLNRVGRGGPLVFTNLGPPRFRHSVEPNGYWISSVGCPGGACTTCVAPVFPAWHVSALRRMLPTRFSITSPAQSQALRQSISDMSFTLSGKKPSSVGALMSHRS